MATEQTQPIENAKASDQPIVRRLRGHAGTLHGPQNDDMREAAIIIEFLFSELQINESDVKKAIASRDIGDKFANEDAYRNAGAKYGMAVDVIHHIAFG